MSPRRAASTAALVAAPTAAAAQTGQPYLTPAQLAHEWAVHSANQEIALRESRSHADMVVALNNHAVAVYWVQLTFSVVLTVFVLAMVGVAIWMSYLQFKASSGSMAGSSIKISKDGVELSSSVVGLFVLLAAMVFFYIYIDKVYDVRQAPGAPTAASPKSPSG